MGSTLPTFGMNPGLSSILWSYAHVGGNRSAFCLEKTFSNCLAYSGR